MSVVPPQDAEILARAVTKVLNLWEVDDDAACPILGIDLQCYSKWKSGSFEPIADDTLLRLVILIGIYTSLRMMFTDPRRGWIWIQKPNTVFQGRSPLEVLGNGDLASLRRVQAYLAAESG